jgi:hypothetical protein
MSNIKKCKSSHDHAHEDDHKHEGAEGEQSNSKKLKEFVKMFFMDILFVLFLCTQEMNDASHLQSLIMQAQYT